MDMCFIDHFSALDDPRRNINVKYDFLDIIFLTIFAVVSGAAGWKDIKDFGDEKIDWLRQYRQYENEIPDEDTIARIIRSIQADAYAGFNELYRTGDITEAACWTHAAAKSTTFISVHPRLSQRKP